MKVITSKTPGYAKGKKLQGNAFYEDSDGDLVITDWTGDPIMVISLNEVYTKNAISWPLRDTSVTSITMSL